MARGGSIGAREPRQTSQGRSSVDGRGGDKRRRRDGRLRWPDPSTIALWLVVAAPPLAALSYGAARPVPWTWLSVSALAAFAVLFAAAAVGRRDPHDGALRAPALLALLALGWAAVQTTLGAASAASALAPTFDPFDPGAAPSVLSLDPHSAWPTVMRMAAYAAAFWVAARAAARLSTARTVIDALALALALHAVYGVGAHLSGGNILLGLDAPPPEIGATGAFMNRNHFAFAALIGLLANLTALRRRLSPPERGARRLIDVIRGLTDRFGWLYGFGAVVCAAAVLLSQSRAGAALAVVGVAALVAAWAATGRAARLRRAALITGVAAMLAVGAAIAGAGLFERLVAPTAANEDRLLLYATVLELTASRPLTGYGLGAFEEAFRPLAPRVFADFDWTAAHNTYLELAVEIGWPATLVWLSAIALVAAEVARGLRRRRRGRDVVVFTLIVIAVGAGHSLVDFPLQIPSLAMIFAVLLGVGWRQSWPSSAPNARTMRPRAAAVRDQVAGRARRISPPTPEPPTAEPADAKLAERAPEDERAAFRRDARQLLSRLKQR